MNQVIHTEFAPAAIGPYSQAVQAGNLLFVSGQLPVDPATGEFAGQDIEPVDPATGEFAGQDIESQTRQSLTNVTKILEKAGYTCADVVKTTVLLADMGDFAAMNAVYGEFSQTRQSLTNVTKILEKAGYTCADVVKTTVLLADMGDFAAMNAVYGEFFRENCPARACFAVKALPKGALVEIEAVACKG